MAQWLGHYGYTRRDIDALVRLVDWMIALPEAVADRIRTATAAQLETWSLNFVDAETLVEVFGD